MKPIGPDENHCKKCGEPVRYATIGSNTRSMGAAFDAGQVPGAGYRLSEEMMGGVANGRWVASYIRVADRDPEALGFRQHDCVQVPQFDDRDMTPVLITGVWTLVHKRAFK